MDRVNLFDVRKNAECVVESTQQTAGSGFASAGDSCA